MILFLLRATSNALATLPCPPYSLASSSSKVVDSAQPEPVCPREPEPETPLPQPNPPVPLFRGRCCSLRHALLLYNAASGDMDSQTNELASSTSRLANAAAAGRRLSNCACGLAGWLAGWRAGWPVVVVVVVAVVVVVVQAACCSSSSSSSSNPHDGSATHFTFAGPSAGP